MACAVFSTVEDAECLRIVDGNDAFAEGELEELELLQRTAGDASVLGMPNLPVLAKRGAQNSDRALAGGLDLEVQIAVRCLHG
jgi:hypothetical protein